MDAAELGKWAGFYRGDLMVNVRSALTLGHARGVALLAAAQAGIPVSAYPPAVVKQSVVGFGRAEKQQVAKMRCVDPKFPGLENHADGFSFQEE